MKLAPVPLSLVLVLLGLADPGLAQKPGIEIAATFKGHGDAVYSVAFSPDGKTLATGSFDNAIKLWDVESGKETRAFAGQNGHTKMVLAIAISPDGTRLASAGADNQVRLWDLSTSPPDKADAKAPAVTPVKNFNHPAIVDSVAFHPTNPVLATGCHDGKVRLWDFAKGAMQKEITAHVDKAAPSPVYTVAFSPDGSKVLTASYDRTLKLYDAANGNFIREMKAYHEKDAPKGHQDEVFSAAFSPDGKLIASGSGGQERVIKIWKTDDGSFVRDLANPELKRDPKAPAASHPGWIYQLRFTRDGRLISAGDAPKNQGYLAVWNVGDGKLLSGETTSFGPLFGLALSADEKQLAVGAGNRGRTAGEFNHAYLLRVPGVNK